MKMFGFSVFFLTVGIASIVIASATSTPSLPDMTFKSNNAGMGTTHNRKLKVSNKNNKKVVENVNVDDYHPIDPAPSSKASITNGPIEHGSPLMPYIPKPTPSTPPRRSGPRSSDKN